MGLQWFRQWVDFLEDPKMVGLAFEDQRHFIAVCALKAKGTLDQNCTPEMLNRIVAQKIWVDFGVITDVKRRLTEAGLIDEFWQPVAWEKRQSKSDSSTDRVRKHREKKRSETACNGDETLQQRSSNVLEKRREEKNREEKSKAFRPPTLDEVMAYSKERGSSVDCQRFHDFYESKGWMVGKNRMKDWKAAYRNWEREAKPQDDLAGGAI